MTKVKLYRPRPDKWRAQYWSGLPGGIVNEYELRAAIFAHGYPEQAIQELYEEVEEEVTEDASDASA